MNPPADATLPEIRSAAKHLRQLTVFSGLAIALAILSGCSEPGRRQRVSTQSTAAEDTKQSQFQNALDMLFNLEEYEPDEALAQIVGRLQDSQSDEFQAKDWKLDPLLNTLPETLAKQPFITNLPDFLQDLNFESDYDGEFLQECVWLHQIAQDVTAGEIDSLGMANRLFDWTIRNVQVEGERGGQPASPQEHLARFHQPWETVLLGRGSVSQRAWVFMLLCRQAKLDASLVAKTSSSGQVAPLAVGVLHEGEIYLYDVLLGLPLGLPGKNPYTLTQLAESEERLRLFDADSRHAYPTHAADYDGVTILLEASPGYLSRRMRSVESRLDPQHDVTLTTSAAAQAERFSMPKHVAAVKLWSRPFDVAAERAGRGESARKAAQAELLFFSSPLIRHARLLQFKGLIEGINASKVGKNEQVVARNERGAKWYYMNARVPPTAAEARDQISAQIFKRVHKDATYWLGVVDFEQGEYSSAVDFLRDRTLKADPLGPWTAGARYLLARTYEAQGDVDKAVEFYRLDRSPQEAGNWLRAKWLKYPPAEPAAKEKQHAEKSASEADKKKPAADPAAKSDAKKSDGADSSPR